MEKEKKIVDISKPEDIDNMKINWYMRFNCKKCGKETVIVFKQRTRIRDYKKILCTSCKTKQTNLEKYGVEHVSQLPEIQEKVKQTFLERYGVENLMQSLEFREKIKQTNLERYGVEYPMQLPEFQEKIKQTTIEKYGVERASQLPEIQEKVKQTNLERYGVEYPMQLPEFQEKIKQTNLERYGVEYPMQLPEFQEKIKQTNLERYGVECLLQSLEFQEKIKQINLEKYGVEYPTQSTEIKEKIKQTTIEKYGVERASQLPEIQEKINCKYEYFGLRFDSSWELYYYIYQTKILKMNCIRNYGEVYFEYIVNGKLHRYIPDFITENKIVEIKGDHLIDDYNNLIKCYKSQDKNKLSAKTQCMLDNVDEIISNEEIKPIIEEVKRLFGAHYIDQFKAKKDEEGLKAS